MMLRMMNVWDFEWKRSWHEFLKIIFNLMSTAVSFNAGLSAAAALAATRDTEGGNTLRIPTPEITRQVNDLEPVGGDAVGGGRRRGRGGGGGGEEQHPTPPELSGR